MRIMVDTNILISVLIFRSEHLTKVIEKAAEQFTLVLCSYVIDEIYAVTNRKFPKHKSTIDRFLSKYLLYWFIHQKKLKVKNFLILEMKMIILFFTQQL